VCSEGILGCRWNSLSSAVVHGSILGPVGEILARANFRERVLCTIDALMAAISLHGPKFAFVHILAPHPPYVFGPKGEFVQERSAATDRNPWDDRAGYLAQVEFVNARLKIFIDSALSASRRSPVIIVQGDHGPATMGTFEVPSADAARERMVILNAYHIGRDDCPVSPDITPVNTFRVIFSCIFDARIDRIADRSYYSGLFPHAQTYVTSILSGDGATGKP
jgi:Sulfatase